MEFFDKKEEVIDLQLTQYGKYLLSLGKLRPIFYAFYDDNTQIYLSGDSGSNWTPLLPEFTRISAQVSGGTNSNSYITYATINFTPTTNFFFLSAVQYTTQNGGGGQQLNRLVLNRPGFITFDVRGHGNDQDNSGGTSIGGRFECTPGIQCNIVFQTRSRDTNRTVTGFGDYEIFF